MNPTPLIALCGFLGSGKTTLLRRWRRDPSLAHAALLVQDLSELGLDSKLLSPEDAKPTTGLLSGRVAALHGPHAREQLLPSVGQALREMAALAPPPPLVLCESTGAARPWPLLQALTQNPRFFLRHFIVTVDALNLHRDFADGQLLLAEAPHHADPALREAAALLAEQLAFASVIILTKIDTLPQPALEAQSQLLQKLQPQATIGLSARAGMHLSQLETTPAPRLAALATRARQLGLPADQPTAQRIESTIFRDPRPFHPERLHAACQSQLGTALYRTKGFLWLASRPAQVLLWQQSGSQITLEITGTWRAEAVQNREGKLFPEEVEHLRAQLADQHPLFGDRHNELALMGQPAACQAFSTALAESLCTEEEILAWQNGQPFPDPWPQNILRLD
ncbi:MAG: GTP-binding protein [Verrucomicrobiota bacterium]